MKNQSQEDWKIFKIMSGYQKVAKVEEIPLGKMKSVEIGFDRFIICHTEEGFFALVDECSHDGAPISDGRVDREGNVVCPRHGARFECKSGEVKAPPAVTAIDTFPVKVEDGDIYINID